MRRRCADRLGEWSGFMHTLLLHKLGAVGRKDKVPSIAQEMRRMLSPPAGRSGARRFQYLDGSQGGHDEATMQSGPASEQMKKDLNQAARSG
jgi:hypothetical protein